MSSQHFRQTYQIISGLLALIGVFLAGLLFPRLALIVILVAISLFLLATFYPHKCPFCGQRMPRKARHCNECEQGRRLRSAVYSIAGPSIFRWLHHLIKVLIGINGILFLALIVSQLVHGLLDEGGVYDVLSVQKGQGQHVQAQAADVPGHAV